MRAVRSVLLLLLFALVGGGADILARTPAPPAVPPVLLRPSGGPTPTETFTAVPASPTATSTATVGCGLQWQVVASPNITAANNYLYSLAVTGPDDLWAVGEAYRNSAAAMSTIGSARQPLHDDALALHYTAGSWSVVPNPATVACQLWDVAGIDSDDVWVAGYCQGNFSSYVPFTLHWDGGQWSVDLLPASISGTFYGVSARAADDAWAVGSYSGTSSAQPLIAHWDGTQWDRVPGPAGSPGWLTRVKMVASDDVWAVGQSSSQQPLAMHWNGQVWSVVPTPTFPAGAALYNLTALAAMVRPGVLSRTST